MSHVITPEVQVRQMGYPLRVACGRTIKIERKTETLEILSDVLVGRIATIERQCRRELRLDRSPHACRNCSRAKLHAFCVQIATKALEVPADEHHITLKAFGREGRRLDWGGQRGRCSGCYHGCENCGAMHIRVPQSRHAVSLPPRQCGRGHGTTWMQRRPGPRSAIIRAALPLSNALAGLRTSDVGGFIFHHAAGERSERRD